MSFFIKPVIKKLEKLKIRVKITSPPFLSKKQPWTHYGHCIKNLKTFGGYPGTADLTEDEKRWENYEKDALIETSTPKDILVLSRVDKPALLKRLFDIGSLYSEQIISFNKILGELQDAGNTTTLSHYLRLLYQAGLLGGNEKYAGKQF